MKIMIKSITQVMMFEKKYLRFFCSLTKPQSFADCVGDELPVGSNYHDDDDDDDDDVNG